MTALPLAGLGVAVTRAEEPSGPLARRLSAAGAHVLHWQTVEIAPPEDPTPLAAAVAGLASYDWLVFSSARAVAAVVAALASPPPATLRAAVVGRATALAAERAGFTVHSVPEISGAAGLLAHFQASGELAGARILLPASAIARPELAAGLAALGGTVHAVTAYRTRAAALDAARCRAELGAGEVDAMTFTSPSAAENLVAALGLAPLVGGSPSPLVVSIGPTTSRALRDLGLEPSTEAEPCTLAGIVAAVARAVTAARWQRRSRE